jgi:hypothetical protein
MKGSVEIRTLQRIVELCGGNYRLAARRLRVSPPSLFLWTKGAEAIPKQVFLNAVDVLMEAQSDVPAVENSANDSKEAPAARGSGVG